DIFQCVVEINVQVALAGDIHVDQRMARELVEHVVEEANPGRHLMRAGAVEIDGDGNLGLVGLAGDGGSAHGLSPMVGRSLPELAAGIKMAWPCLVPRRPHWSMSIAQSPLVLDFRDAPRPRPSRR